MLHERAALPDPPAVLVGDGEPARSSQIADLARVRITPRDAR
jgi:hypothetical protein